MLVSLPWGKLHLRLSLSQGTLEEGARATCRQTENCTKVICSQGRRAEEPVSRWSSEPASLHVLVAPASVAAKTSSIHRCKREGIGVQQMVPPSRPRGLGGRGRRLPHEPLHSLVKPVSREKFQGPHKGTHREAHSSGEPPQRHLRKASVTFRHSCIE